MGAKKPSPTEKNKTDDDEEIPAKTKPLQDNSQSSATLTSKKTEIVLDDNGKPQLRKTALNPAFKGSNKPNPEEQKENTDNKKDKVSENKKSKPKNKDSPAAVKSSKVKVSKPEAEDKKEEKPVIPKEKSPSPKPVKSKRRMPSLRATARPRMRLRWKLRLKGILNPNLRW